MRRQLGLGAFVGLLGVGVLLYPSAASAVVTDGATVTLQAADQMPDNTALIQGYLDNAKYTLIKIQPGPANASWLTGPVVVKHDNTEIHLEAGTVLEAKPGSYPHDNDSVIKAGHRGNVKITGHDAESSKITMHKPEYATMAGAEDRHAINIITCNSVTVSGLTLAQTGGDGIYLGKGTVGEYCSNVTISDMVIDGAARNALSVISVDGLTVTRCTFKNTIGQGKCAAGGPWAGVDLEPNSSSDLLSNIVVTSCKFLDNGGTSEGHTEGYGFGLGTSHLKGSKSVVGITVKDCVMSGSVYGFQSSPIAGTLDPKSAILVQDCTIENNSDMGIYIVSKAKAAGTMTFKNCTLKNNNTKTDGGYHACIAIYTDSATKEPGGNIFFDNVTIEQQAKLPYCLAVWGLPAYHVDGVHGTIITNMGTVHTQDADNVDVKVISSASPVK